MCNPPIIPTPPIIRDSRVGVKQNKVTNKLKIASYPINISSELIAINNSNLAESVSGKINKNLNNLSNFSKQMLPHQLMIFFGFFS